MRPRGRRGRGVALLLWTAAGLALATGPAGAEEGSSRWHREEEEPFAKLPPIGPKIQERRERALELYFDDRYEEAKQELGKIFLNRLNPAETAAVHEVYAYIANALEDRAEARRRLRLAVETVDEGGMRPDKALELGYQIAMLFIQDEMWKEAAEAQEQWFAGARQAAMVGLAQPPNARAHYMLALTYYRLEDYAKALEPAERAVEMGDPPLEAWLQLLLGIRLIEKQYEEAIPVLEQLISRYPAKGHFMNLATVYGALGRLEEAAVPLQLAHEQGHLDSDSDLRRLAQMLLYLNLPYRAARVLERGLESGVLVADTGSLSMLGNSWIGAREFEKAVDPLERAAELSEDGQLFVRLAQVFIQREEWGEAARALRRGLEKGGLLDPGEANLLMGIAFYSQEDREQARRWFQRARDFEKTRDEAEVWIAHVETELAELAAKAAEQRDLEAAGG